MVRPVTEPLVSVAVAVHFSPRCLPVKKAYYKLSLQVHPDRVPDEEKDIATEKFKVLSTINSILTDKDKKALYDEQGIIDDNDDAGTLSSWLDLWKRIFKPITTEDIDNFQRGYVGKWSCRTVKM